MRCMRPFSAPAGERTAMLNRRCLPVAGASLCDTGACGTTAWELEGCCLWLLLLLLLLLSLLLLLLLLELLLGPSLLLL